MRKSAGQGLFDWSRILPKDAETEQAGHRPLLAFPIPRKTS